MRNKLRSLLYIAATVGLFALSSCSDEETSANAYNGGEEFNDEYVDYRKPKGSVTLKIDSKSNPYGIKGVNVVLVTGDNSGSAVVTDTLGEAIYKNLEMGTYKFMISKAGFAPIYKTVTLANESTEAEVPKVGNITESVALLELSVSAKGKVVYTNKDGNNIPAKNAPVEIMLVSTGTSSFVEEIITTTTDSLGDYSVLNLIPENTTAMVYVKSIEVGGQKYKGATIQTISPTFAGELEYVPTIKMSINAADFMIYSTNLKAIKFNENIKIVVSEDIDTSAIKYGDITVSKGTEIMTNYVVSANLRELTIVPTSGNWGTSGTYTINIDLTSKDNEMLSEILSFSFEVVGPVGIVTGITVVNPIVGTLLDTNVVDGSTGGFNMKWNPLANVVGYKIFKKATGDSNFTFVKTVPDTAISIISNGWFTGNKSVSLVVIGYNSENQSDITKSQIITLSDKLGPIAAFEDIQIGRFTDLDNTLGTTSLLAGTASVMFSEVVDTTAIVITSPNPTVTSYKWQWLSTKNARITAYVLAGQDASAHAETVPVNVSTIKDLLGNVAVASEAILNVGFNN